MTGPTAIRGWSRTGHVVRRLAATAADLVVVAGWAGVSGLVGFALASLGVTIESPRAWDLFALLTLVAPVVVTLALMDAAPGRGSPGKRWLSLAVVDLRGGRVSRARSLARTTVKFLPWQVAHTAVFQLAAGNDSSLYVVLALGAQAVVLVSMIAAVIDDRHRALHDRVAGTTVVNEMVDTRPKVD